MATTNTFGYKLTLKGTRFLASFVKSIIFVLVSLGFYQLIGISFEDYLNSDFQLIDITYSALASLVLGAILYPLFMGNLGHRIFNLKVISSEDGSDYNKAEKGAIRECLKYVLAYLIVPIIWILWDEKNQNLYDKLTKTLVVEKK